jgi:phage gp36-like protein
MPYLTAVEYVGRYGERETTLFTNTNSAQPSASYDPVKVESAIDDATEEVNSYIAKRYATPLVSVPPLAKAWVAAIARLKLAEGTGRVPEAVQTAADRATRQLEQLVANKLDIPAPELGAGDAPATLGTGAPMSSGDRSAPVFTGGALDLYTAPFLGGGYAPCWRQGG